VDELEKVLERLAEAEEANEELHRRDSTLEERVQLHDEVTRLRAEAAQIRTRLGIGRMTPPRHRSQSQALSYRPIR
jgi:hypothetical protein